MPKSSQNWLIHLLAGIGFLLIPVILAPQPAEVSRFDLDGPTVRELVANAFILGFFYLNYYYLVPRLFLQKRYFPYLIWLVLFLILVVFISNFQFFEFGSAMSHGPEKLGPPPPGANRLGPKPQPHFPFLEDVSRINYQVLLYSLVALFSIVLRMREALYQTKLEGDKAEIHALKSQINPHFLFNTLNSIYALSIRENAPKTGESVIKLSQMMRYVVSEANQEKVSLEKEIAYMEGYIELQKLRLPSDFKISIEKKGEFSNQKIAPILLIPFLENAFKHGVSPEEPGEINIKLVAEISQLTFEVINLISKHPLQTHEESGLGLTNTENRLKLIYGSNYELELGEKNGYFQVKLQIPL